MAKQNYHHGDLRIALLRTARKEIARHGAHAVTLSSLAKQAGVSQPAPYRHFADRKDLLRAVAAEGFHELNHLLSQTGNDKNDNWRAMAHAYATFGEKNVELYRLMFASRLVPEAEPKSDLATAADRAFELLRLAMEEAGKPVSEAYLLWAQLHGLVMLEADGLLQGSASVLLETALSIRSLSNNVR